MKKKLTFLLTILAFCLSLCMADDVEDGVFNEVADLDLETLPQKTIENTSKNNQLFEDKDLKKIIESLKGLSIRGLAQVQLDHVHSEFNENSKTKSKSKLNFRRLGLLFSKNIYKDLSAGIQADFNVDENKVEMGKVFIKKTFETNPYFINSLEFTFDEKSLGYESSISNIVNQRVEKSIAASYFKNTIKSFSLNIANAPTDVINYKLHISSSDNKKTPKHYFTYGSLSKKTKLAEEIDTKYGINLGYIHRDKTSDHTVLYSMFNDLQYGPFSTIIEGFLMKNTQEKKTPIGASIQQTYDILSNNTIVLGYSFIHTQGSKTTINPSQLERGAPTNIINNNKPAFKTMHAVYIGDEWRLTECLKFIGGYEFGYARKAYANSSLKKNNLHALRLRFQVVF